MAIYTIKGTLKQRIFNKLICIASDIDNMVSKLKVYSKKLKYCNITRIEYSFMETPEFIFENMCIDKDLISKRKFNRIISVLEKNDVLKWKKNYISKNIYYDGCEWSLKITFNDGEIFVVNGDITFPKQFEPVYDKFKEYIITSNDEELNIKVINKWFKSNI